MKLLPILLLFLCTLGTSLAAQEVDSIAIDTTSLVDSLQQTPPISTTDSLAVTPTKKKKSGLFSRGGPRSPRKALLLSLIIPGGGQFYNKRYWKVPIVYAAVGGMIYLVDQNTKDYKFVRDEYIKRVDGDPETVDFFEQYNWTDADIKNLRDQYNKNKELAYIGLVAVHLLSAVEAFVDAHLRDFEINEDLGLRLEPSIENSLQGPVMGFGVSLQFQRKKTPQPIDFFNK